MTAMVDDDAGFTWRVVSLSCVGDFFSAIAVAQEDRAARIVARHLQRFSDDELFAFGLREDHIDRLRCRTRAERPPRPLRRYSVIGKVKPRTEEDAA
jgi:hypothetical protein